MTPTLDDILAISGNRPVFEALTTLMRDEKALAFVGAGASAGLYPMWNRFIELLADHAVTQGKAEPRDAERWKKDTASTPQQRVNTIVRKLGEPLYRNFLKTTFGPTRDADGKRYTPVHAALLRLPFRGYVTTNYDPSLDFARAELRSDSLSTGTPTWQDDDEVYRWRTGDIFQRDDCPMLWLHGYWQRPDGIVLNSGEYSQAYKPGIYRDTFKELWIRERLVFLGFGFADPQFNFMVGEFLRDLTDANASPRHIAIFGWPMPDDGSAPDSEEIKEKRDNFEADYHLRALFYPVKNGDHSALHVLLEGIGARTAMSARTRSEKLADKAVHAPLLKSTSLPTKWVHETTNDDKFTGRQDELQRLDHWVRDETVRIVAVCAVGGTGKTALIGHWLKNTAGWCSRPFAGLFAWSFYQNRDTDDFLETLLQWAHEIFGTPKPDEKTDLLDAVARLLHGRTLVLVLDGLEVIQEGPEDARHGSFLDPGLRELLHALSEDASSSSLAVLTSRFGFADLERHLGTAFHQLEIHGLPPDQGARLLDELGVRGPPADREEVSRRLDGHPLALRVFAESLPDAVHTQPRRFLDHAFKPSDVAPVTSLNDKLRRLLGFYEKKLPRDHVRLLSIVALFRSPVAEETILRLARGLFGQKKKQPLPNDAALSRALTVLHNRGILSREPIDGGHGYACHPILRDHFRAVLLGTGADTARRAADLLTGKPSDGRVQSAREIEPVLAAVELLQDSGEFDLAIELWRHRLEKGEVFKRLPAPQEGIRCIFGFVRNETRKKQCEERIGKGSSCFFESFLAGLFALAGEYENALKHVKLAGSLANLDDVLFEIGNLREALSVAQNEVASSLEVLSNLPNEGRLNRYTEEFHKIGEVQKAKLDLGFALASQAHLKSMLGLVRTASADFFAAKQLCEHASYDGLCSSPSAWWSEMSLRTGFLKRAQHLSEDNLRVCEKYGWFRHAAECRWIDGWCSLLEGKLSEADSELRNAESTFHRGQLLFDLARLHLTVGGLALARQDAPGAFHRVAEALALAQPRGMKLVHADALVLRGRARLLEAKPDAAIRALDDATDALRLARDCDYPWAERDALFLEADARTALVGVYAQTDHARANRERTTATKARTEAEAIAKKLVLTDEDLARADREAQAWLADWEKQDSSKGEKPKAAIAKRPK